jgi:pimeloyl-ACP methyl ester carboxylesterase
MFVLVHGAWHGSWCWEQLENQLGELGATSLAVDLPGRAGDPTPAEDLTLDAYVDAVIAAFDASSQPVVLVGHSLGGLVISQTAERVPERISSLVYLCAMLLQNGQSTIDAATADPDSRLMENISLNEAGTASVVAAGAVRDLFYGDCPVETSERAMSLLVPEPIIPASTPLQVTTDRWGSVPRSYIVCNEDRAISPAKQRTMIGAVGVDQVREMDSSHSPFFSQPDRLAGMLIDLEKGGERPS